VRGASFNSLDSPSRPSPIHLRVLARPGYRVAHKREDTGVYYRLVPEAVEALAFALGGAPEPKLVLATAEGTVAR